ncbi:MAG: hypothetical protein IJC56_07525 [Clostridia bacterium]|nr:hypothetical protein [Clostridia bacterium]
MANIYDSELIREASRKARRLAVRVEGNVAGLQARTEDDMEIIKGNTARAMEEKIGLLEKQIKSLGYEIREVSELLANYASALEAVGADLVDVMSGR